MPGAVYPFNTATRTNGLNEIEVIRRRRSGKGMEDVDMKTLKWVNLFKKRRLLESTGNIPPAEAEEHCDARNMVFDTVA